MLLAAEHLAQVDDDDDDDDNDDDNDTCQVELLRPGPGWPSVRPSVRPGPPILRPAQAPGSILCRY